MDLLQILWHVLRVYWLSKPWIELMVLILLMCLVLYFAFFILSKTAVSRFWKIFMTLLVIPFGAILFNLPHFYAGINAGIPDKNCPEITFNAIGELEPIQYDYMGQHVIVGTEKTGVVDLFLRNYQIFGESLVHQNSHICRIPYNDTAKKLLSNIQRAIEARSKAATAANVPPNQASQFGRITITLPGSVQSKAQLDSYLKQNKDKKYLGERDESFGFAEFNVPKVEDVPKAD